MAELSFLVAVLAIAAAVFALLSTHRAHQRAAALETEFTDLVAAMPTDVAAELARVRVQRTGGAGEE